MDEKNLIPNYPGYEASRNGDVFGLKGQRLTPARKENGYYFIGLGAGKRGYIHRLVASTFLGPCPDRCEVNHKDGDKANNAVDNPEYVSSAQNKAHAYQHGLVHHAGEQNGRATLSDEEIREIRTLGASGMLQKEIAERYGVRKQTVGQILRGERWKHVGGPLSLRGHAGEFNGRYKGRNRTL